MFMIVNNRQKLRTTCFRQTFSKTIVFKTKTIVFFNDRFFVFEKISLMNQSLKKIFNDRERRVVVNDRKKLKTTYFR